MFHNELAELLYAKMVAKRMNFIGAFSPRDIPPLPNGWTHTLGNSDHPHDCQSEPIFHLPLVLVMDVRVPYYKENPGADDQLSYTTNRFRPYWLVGGQVVHDFTGAPPTPSRAMTPIEAACAFAQNPRCGSMQIHIDKHRWGHPRMQTYWCPETERVVFRGNQLRSHDFHLALCQYIISAEQPLY